MDENLLPEIRTRLGRYLSGKSSLDQFRKWFDVETWGLAAEPDSLVRQIAGEIELRMAEFTNGHLSETDLRALLQPLLDREQVADHADHRTTRR
jgi:hypothetical protein